jgi:hypothetical protein
MWHLLANLVAGAIERAHWWTAEEVYKYVRLDQHEGRDILLVGPWHMRSVRIIIVVPVAVFT